jgi:PAS domain S-box-containing protein
MHTRYSPGILLVDDNEENLLTLKSTLRSVEAQFVMAQSGKEAVLYTKQKDFGVIILDVQMPEMDGYETATKIRQGTRNQFTPIIFLTAVYSDTPNLIKGYHNGAVDYITKPFTREILISKVRFFLELDKVKNDLIESKTNFENVVQDQTDMICRTDQMLYPTFVNQAFLRAFSTSFEHIKTKPVVDAIKQPDRDKINRALLLLSPANPIIKLKHQLSISNGRQLTVSTVFRALYDENLLHTGYQLVIRDVTRDIQSMEDLLIEKKTLEEATKSKALFLANLNHDLRTPLNSIIGMSEVLMDTSLDEDQLEDAQVIQIAAFKLLSLLNNLADYTKTEANQIIISNNWFDLKTGLSDAIKSYIAKQNVNKSQVKLNFTKNVPSKINSDPKRIGQIAGLLVRVLEYFAGDETINIEIRSENEDNNHVNLILIVDCPVDIPIEFAEKIKRFFDHGDPELSHETGELALGLAVSKNLCKLMGGSVSFKQGEEQNPAFHISIKVETEPGKNPNMVSILVVEDNLLNQKVVGATLRKRGFAYDLASDGKTALEKFRQNRFDFILMDIQMPVMDGYETTRQIREIEKAYPTEKTAKIYALTANATSEDQRKCFAAGMNGFLTKPFNYTELEKIIRAVADENQIEAGKS